MNLLNTMLPACRIYTNYTHDINSSLNIFIESWQISILRNGSKLKESPKQKIAHPHFGGWAIFDYF